MDRSAAARFKAPAFTPTKEEQMRRMRTVGTMLCAAMLLVLVGCGGNGNGSRAVVTPGVVTPYEMVVAAIAKADTAEDAQAAYDAVKDDVTAAEGGKLQAAVDARVEALMAMTRQAGQKLVLMTAAGEVDTSDLSTAEAIAAVNTAVAALQAALDAAADVSDSDKAMYQGRLDAAQSAIDHADQTMALTDAVGAIQAIDLSGLSDQEAIGAAEAAIAALQTALGSATALTDAQKSAAMIELAAAKRTVMAAGGRVGGQQRMAVIDTAKDLLDDAEAKRDALADDATDVEKLASYRKVAAAADALRDALRENGGSDADIEDAIRTAQSAKIEADAIHVTITAAKDAEDNRKMEAIDTAQMTLSVAETALAELDEDATDKEKRSAHRAVEKAAAALITALEANDGKADQIAAATDRRDSAKTMADDLTSPIDIASQRKAITAALADLTTKVAAVKDNSSESVVAAADTAIADARKAIADADALTDREKSLSTQLVDAQLTVLASAKASRQIVLDEKIGKDRDKAKAASNKVALTKKKAIEDEAAGDSTDRPFDGGEGIADDATSNATATTAYSLSVKHTGSAVEATVRDERNLAENDPVFAKMATFGDGQMLVRDIGKMREIIVVHTDIEAPDNILFGTASGYGLTEDLDDKTTADDTLVVSSDTHGSKLGGSKIVGPDKADTKTLDQWTTGAPAKNVYPGTLDGAAGTFRCQSTVCTVTTGGEDGVHTFVGTLWFTPNAGATVKRPDNDYMTYGFWLKTTTKGGEIVSYDTVQTFAMSELPVAGSLSTVTGTATYDGDAAGVYVHETKNEDGTLDTATSGRFTADVSMTAYFDAIPNVRPEDSLAGTISNFELDGGPNVSWKVDVAAGIDDTGSLVAGGTAKGGVTGQPGSISGTFHAPVERQGADAPSVLIGEFNANFVNGAAAGAFGARKK